MKKNNIFLAGLVALALTASLALTACGGSGGGGGGGGGAIGFTTWNGTYTATGSPTRSVTITGGISLLLTDFHLPVNQQLFIALGGVGPHTIAIDPPESGGVIKAGNAAGAVIGQYTYVRRSGTRIGILAYANIGVDTYSLGLGITGGQGAAGVVSGWRAQGAYFDPNPDSIVGAMTADYGWSGNK